MQCPVSGRWTTTIEDERGEKIQWCQDCQQKHQPRETRPIHGRVIDKESQETPVLGDWI